MNFQYAFLMSMFNNRQSGILGNFKGIGKVLTGIAISLGVGAIILGSFQGMAYDDVLIQNEVHTPAETDGIQNSDNVTLVVDNVGQGLEESSETLTYYDASAGTNSTLTSSNYSIISYKNGKFDVVSVPEYNESDGDNIYIDYTKHEKSASSGILGDGLGLLQDTIGFMEIAVVMLFGVIFMRYME